MTTTKARKVEMALDRMNNGTAVLFGAVVTKYGPELYEIGSIDGRNVVTCAQAAERISSEAR
jgi:hypothetical protein